MLEYFRKQFYITPLGASKYQKVDLFSSLFSQSGVIGVIAEAGDDGISMHELAHLTHECSEYIMEAIKNAMNKGYVRVV